MQVMTRQLMPLVPHVETLTMPAFRIYLKSIWDSWTLNPDKPATSGRPFLVRHEGIGTLAVISHAREMTRPILLRGDSGRQYLKEVIPELGQVGFIPTNDNGPGRTLPKMIWVQTPPRVIRDSAQRPMDLSRKGRNCRPDGTSELTLKVASELSKIVWGQRMKPIVVVRVEHSSTVRTISLYHPTVSIQSADTNQTATIHLVWEDWYREHIISQGEQIRSAKTILRAVCTRPAKGTEPEEAASDTKKPKIEPEDMTMDQGIRGGEANVGDEGVEPVTTVPSVATPMASGKIGTLPNLGRANEHPETTCKENQEADTAHASSDHHAGCKRQLLLQVPAPTADSTRGPTDGKVDGHPA